MSLDIRRDLLANALQAGENPQEPRLYVLGGSLVDSAFGDPQASQASLLYIAAHPWMHVLRAADLASLPLNIQVDLPSDGQAALPIAPFPPYSRLSSHYAQGEFGSAAADSLLAGGQIALRAATTRAV